MTPDRKIDPVTGDYVDAAGGKFEEVDVLENQIAVSFLTDLGSWEGDPNLGHRLGELERTTDMDLNRRRLAEYGKAALAWLVEDGSLDSVDVDVESISAGRVAFQVSAYRPGERNPVPLPTFLVPVGGSP